MANAADIERWKNVGERVGALIRLRGYKSVELFAHEHEIDKSVLNRLIRGRREVRLSTFLHIVEALEVSNLYDLRPAPMLAPGWPQTEGYPLKDVLLLILDEEWWHRQFAERDLAVLR